jgi:hypothetical protein
VYPLRRQQCSQEGRTPFLPHAVFENAEIPNCQFGTGMKKGADAATNPYRNAPMPDWDVGYRTADAGGISLETDAQPWNKLWNYLTTLWTRISSLRLIKCLLGMYSLKGQCSMKVLQPSSKASYLTNLLTLHQIKLCAAMTLVHFAKNYSRYFQGRLSDFLSEIGLFRQPRGHLLIFLIIFYSMVSGLSRNLRPFSRAVVRTSCQRLGSFVS